MEGGAGEGLRSVEVTPSPNQERVLYPARRSPFIGLGLYGAPVFIMLVSLAAPLSLSYLPWRGLRFALVLCRYKIDATPLEKRGKGLEFRWEAPALRFAPSRCPKLSPLCGCVCVHQNMIPDDMSIPSSASPGLSGWGYAATLQSYLHADRLGFFIG